MTDIVTEESSEFWNRIKQQVNKVMLPKLIAHQNRVQKAKREVRAQRMTKQESNVTIVQSSEEFDETYAAKIQKAASVARTLPAGSQVPLERIVSSEKSLAEARALMTARISETSESRSSALDAG